MSSIVRLTRRFVGILCLSILLLLSVNVVILIVIAANQTPGAGPSPAKQGSICRRQKRDTFCRKIWRRN